MKIALKVEVVVRLDQTENDGVILDETGFGFRRLDECFRKRPGIILEFLYSV